MQMLGVINPLSDELEVAVLVAVGVVVLVAPAHILIESVEPSRNRKLNCARSPMTTTEQISFGKQM
jgi:hypothetical protein